MATINLALTLLAVLTSLACTVLLFRAYAQTALRLLLWSALCFVGLAVSNLLLFVDVVILPTQVDLLPLRQWSTLAAIAVLLYGFIWEAE